MKLKNKRNHVTSIEALILFGWKHTDAINSTKQVPSTINIVNARKSFVFTPQTNSNEASGEFVSILCSRTKMSNEHFFRKTLRIQSYAFVQIHCCGTCIRRALLHAKCINCILYKVYIYICVCSRAQPVSVHISTKINDVTQSIHSINIHQLQCITMFSFFFRFHLRLLRLLWNVAGQCGLKSLCKITTG